MGSRDGTNRPLGKSRIILSCSLSLWRLASQQQPRIFYFSEPPSLASGFHLQVHLTGKEER